MSSDLAEYITIEVNPVFPAPTRGHQSRIGILCQMHAVGGDL